MGLRIRIPPWARISVVSVVCCQIEVSTFGWSLVQRSSTNSGVFAIMNSRQWGHPGSLGGLLRHGVGDDYSRKHCLGVKFLKIWLISQLGLYALYNFNCTSHDSKHYATNRQFAGSIPNGVIGIFQWHNPSGRAMALGSTQPLTEMSTRCVSYDIFVNCNWVVTRWQYTFTHKQYIEL